jgi:hypothetical protein
MLPQLKIRALVAEKLQLQTEMRRLHFRVSNNALSSVISLSSPVNAGANSAQRDDESTSPLTLSQPTDVDADDGTAGGGIITAQKVMTGKNVVGSSAMDREAMDRTPSITSQATISADALSSASFKLLEPRQRLLSDENHEGAHTSDHAASHSNEGQQPVRRGFMGRRMRRQAGKPSGLSMTASPVWGGLRRRRNNSVSTDEPTRSSFSKMLVHTTSLQSLDGYMGEQEQCAAALEPGSPMFMPHCQGVVEPSSPLPPPSPNLSTYNSFSMSQLASRAASPVGGAFEYQYSSGFVDVDLTQVERLLQPIPIFATLDPCVLLIICA